MMVYGDDKGAIAANLADTAAIVVGGEASVVRKDDDAQLAFILGQVLELLGEGSVHFNDARCHAELGAEVVVVGDGFLGFEVLVHLSDGLVPRGAVDAADGERAFFGIDAQVVWVVHAAEVSKLRLELLRIRRLHRTRHLPLIRELMHAINTQIVEVNYQAGESRPDKIELHVRENGVLN